MSNIILHGVYKIKAPQACYIVEMSIEGLKDELDLSRISFDVNIPSHGVRSQAPFEEHFISLDGNKVLGDFEYAWDHPEVWIGTVRIAFLMHFLEEGKALKTPFGELLIPEITLLPQRLKCIKYVSPY